MSRDFYIDVTLDIRADPERINQIIARGAWLGFAYLRVEYSSGTEDAYIQPEEALFQVITGLVCARLNPHDVSVLPHVVVKALETYISVLFYERNDKLAISLRPTGNYWVEEGEDADSEEVDVDRYMQLLIDWCRDFKLLGLEIIDGYDDKYL
jgi:hypothetical protein